MKKLIAILTLSAFTFSSFATSVNPVLQKDTTKTKKDTTKKPKPAAHRR